VLERRSRTTYRPTVTPQGSTHVDTFTGTTSSVSRTACRRLAVRTAIRHRIWRAQLSAPDNGGQGETTALLGKRRAVGVGAERTGALR